LYRRIAEGGEVTLRAPFPWFGGKSRASADVWAALGDVRSYVEPFAGSLAVLLGRPDGWSGSETVNDVDGMIVNFWRAVAAEPDAVEAWHDWPVMELDLTARHLWLVARKDALRARLEADPDYYDVQIAGWWVWGICGWIGSGWCSGEGPWTTDGERVTNGNAGMGVHRQLPHLGDAGMGVHRQLPHLGNAGRGVHRQLPRQGNALAEPSSHAALAARLRRVRVACGDWSRVVTPSAARGAGGPGVSIGVFLDPPYPDGEMGDYGASDVAGLWRDVCVWAVEHGAEYRVVLAGYEGTFEPPVGWTARKWHARMGYAGQGDGTNENRRRETLWCSPTCVPVRAPGLFA
jgi:hypothetical protein